MLFQSPLPRSFGSLAMFAAMRLSFIESQRLGNSSIALVGMAVDIGDGLFVGVHDLEAAVRLLNGPWCWESSHWHALNFLARFQSLAMASYRLQPRALGDGWHE